jgi:hypothetical protein
MSLLYVPVGLAYHLFLMELGGGVDPGGGVEPESNLVLLGSPKTPCDQSLQWNLTDLHFLGWTMVMLSGVMM